MADISAYAVLLRELHYNNSNELVYMCFKPITIFAWNKKLTYILNQIQ